MRRMTNTYMLAGQDNPATLFLSERRHVRCELWRWAGGHHQRKFVFSASEAYLIEDGQLPAPLRGATLMVKRPDVLTSFHGWKRLKLDEGVGTCEKTDNPSP